MNEEQWRTIAIILAIIFACLAIYTVDTRMKATTYELDEGFVVSKAELEAISAHSPNDRLGRFLVCEPELGKCLMVGKLE